MSPVTKEGVMLSFCSLLIQVKLPLMFCVTVNKSKGRQSTFAQKYIRAVHKYSHVGFFGRGGGGSEICQRMLQASHLYSDNSRLVNYTEQVPCP